MWEHVTTLQCPESPRHDVIRYHDVGKLLVVTSSPIGGIVILTSSCHDTGNDKCHHILGKVYGLQKDFFFQFYDKGWAMAVIS